LLRREAGLTATVAGLKTTTKRWSVQKIWPYWLHKGAQNVETLESIKEKDLKITRMQDALTKRQCYTCFGY
jgi:chemotaxis protein MotB